MDVYTIAGISLLDIEHRKSSACKLVVEGNQVLSINTGDTAEARGRCLDGTGLLMMEGWVDAHVHAYVHPGAIGVDATAFLKDGVTAIVDAGTAGPGNFEDFLEKELRHSPLESKAFLNLAYMGISSAYPELQKLEDMNSEACITMLSRYPETLLGIKLRIDPRVCGDPEGALRLARKISDASGKPIVVHASRCPLPLSTILSYLKKGDIYAHTYADKSPGLLDDKGYVKKEAWEARERGVLFDLSHGNGNFSFPVFQKALAQGFYPDAISSDIHSRSLRNVESLAMVMSKVLSCGLDPWSVWELVTRKARAMVGMEQHSDFPGDPSSSYTLCKILKGKFSYKDSDGNVLTGSRKIVPIGAICSGKVYGLETLLESSN